MKSDLTYQHRLREILIRHGHQLYERLAWRIEAIFGPIEYTGKRSEIVKVPRGQSFQSVLHDRHVLF